MVTKLLDFQKADSQEVNMSVSQLQLKSLLQTQIEKFIPRASQKNIIIKLDSCPTEESVWMDSNMADSIFENLISHSIIGLILQHYHDLYIKSKDSLRLLQ